MGSMNPHHQFYSDYPAFHNELSGGFPVSESSSSCCGGGGAMWCDQDTMIPIIDGLSPDSSSDVAVGPAAVPVMAVPNLFPEQQQQQLGVVDCGGGVVPNALISDHYSSSSMVGGLHGVNYGVGFHNNSPHEASCCEFGEECCGFFMPHEFKPVGLVPHDNWGIQSGQFHSLEESNIKVGRYSEEERKERILRYLKKRNQRNFNKTIKYACRKTLADRRVRVRGRFARNNELCDQEIVAKKSENPTRKERELCCGDAVQMKYDEDQDWLQEAMASLLCLPYVAG